MGDRESLALAEAMLALGVKKFSHGDVSVEFHDAAISHALADRLAKPSESTDPEEAYRVARKAEEEAQREAGGDLDLLFRSVG